MTLDPFTNQMGPGPLAVEVFDLEQGQLKAVEAVDTITLHEENLLLEPGSPC
ncbi:MAG: hypothetical protein AB7S38_16820 [Vulcanimicrobiota bacterium]